MRAVIRVRHGQGGEFDRGKRRLVVSSLITLLWCSCPVLVPTTPRWRLRQIIAWLRPCAYPPCGRGASFLLRASGDACGASGGGGKRPPCGK